MSSYTFNPPSTPTYGFFPTGITSPNAFSGFHQSPRDTHAMYAAAFNPSAGHPGYPTTSQSAGQPQQSKKFGSIGRK
ncbi:hypothetical protein PQX77_002033 [Marasmius sp. AFHP31]|nr:hypothetical protein PQX77_002033 [Marasmius sp. AFHP31]